MSLYDTICQLQTQAKTLGVEIARIKLTYDQYQELRREIVQYGNFYRRPNLKNVRERVDGVEIEVIDGN